MCVVRLKTNKPWLLIRRAEFPLCVARGWNSRSWFDGLSKPLAWEHAGEWRAACLRETSKGSQRLEPSEGNEVSASLLLGGCLQAMHRNISEVLLQKLNLTMGISWAPHLGIGTVLRVPSLSSAQSPASRHESHHSLLCSAMETSICIQELTSWSSSFIKSSKSEWYLYPSLFFFFSKYPLTLRD